MTLFEQYQHRVSTTTAESREHSLARLHDQRQAGVDRVGCLLSFLGGHLCASGNDLWVFLEGVLVRSGAGFED